MKFSAIPACRICGSEDLHSLIDLGAIQSCGDFPAAGEPDAPAAPVELIRCQGCGLVQLRHDYDRDDLFRRTYGYRSGINQTMRDHLASIAAEAAASAGLKPGDLVLDIGSNDATLLTSYPVTGLRRLGIDPTIAQYADYYPADIEKLADFFTAETFGTLAGAGAKARVITSIAMFYDLPDPGAFVADIKAALATDGIWLCEQSYMPTMLRTNSLDTLCHEHLEYYTVKQIVDLLSRHGMALLSVSFNDINGGSFRFAAGHQDGPHQPDAALIAELLAREQAMGLDGDAVFIAFREAAERMRAQLLDLLRTAKAQGKLVHGYGASTKGNTTLQYCGIGPDLLPAIADRNPVKWGRRTPGTAIPIISEDESRAAGPDYWLVLPWHFRAEFLARETDFLARGGKFVFPMPEFEIVGAEPAAT